jgi:hypothetical protein
MNITIIGGGNVGTLMAAEFAYRGHNVTLYTAEPKSWNETIEVYSAEEEMLFSSRLYRVTNSLKEALEGSEFVWITLPAFLFGKLSNDILQYVEKGQYIGIVPGSGGAEFAFQRLVEKGCILFGLQRVHSIARIREYGKSVYMLGRKQELQIGAIPAKESLPISYILTNLFGIRCKALPNYLSVTLTPSNPILHTTRLYTMFKDYNEERMYPRNIFFYEEWDDESSKNLIDCDDELQVLCDQIPMPLESVQSLRNYYESFTIPAMTGKIKSIKAFRGMMSPMKRVENGWIPDFESRYFTADFPWGLKVIKEIASVFGVVTPSINKVWNWYECNVWDRKQGWFNLPLNRDEFLELYR